MMSEKQWKLEDYLGYFTAGAFVSAHYGGEVTVDEEGYVWKANKKVADRLDTPTKVERLWGELCSQET